MRPFTILVCLFYLSITSCKNSPSEQEKFRDIIEGDWLVIAPDHKLENKQQREIYGKIQDSIVDTKSLKLVRFLEDGTFYQVDHPEQKGKWAVSPDQELFVGNGGDGFEDFKVKYSNFVDNSKLQVTEQVRARDQTFKLVWHMRKIYKSELFKPGNNTWRNKSAAKESEKALRQRLSTMLNYYSEYYRLVSDNSIFFIGTRVVLPFRYYAHGMGMLPYNGQSDFAKLFFDNEQAEEAYGYLNSAFDKAGSYPSGKNYVIEYSTFMGVMAERIIQ